MSQPSSPDRRSSRRGMITVAAVTAVCLLPFVNRAFHIDDTLFLSVARQILQEPLSPYDFQYSWEYDPHRSTLSMWEINQNPPLNSYFLAGLVAMAGQNELVLHVAYLVFSVGCAVLMYWLAQRFCAHAMSATLASVLSPAFLVSACSVMCDVPQLFFWLLAVMLTVRAADRKRPRDLWQVGLATAVAAMTKYFGIALMPLLGVYWLARQRRFSWPMLWLLLPIVPLTAWGFMGLDQEGIFHPLRAASFAAKVKNPLHDVLSILPFLGGTMVWPLILVLAGQSLRLWARLLCLALFLGVFATLWIEFPGYHGIIYVHSVMSFAGAFLIALAAASSLGRIDADSLLLGLWFFGTVVFSTFVNWTVNTRVVLPAVFPAAVLALRWIESQPNSDRKLQVFRMAIAPTMLIAFIVAKADYDFADAPREFVRTDVAPLVQDGRPLLFVGHWGLQHYLERLGATYYDYAGPKPPAGTYLVHPVQETNPFGTAELLTHQIPLDPFVFGLYPNNVGIHTMEEASRAGFYATVIGPLPYNRASDAYIARFAVDRVGFLPPKEDE